MYRTITSKIAADPDYADRVYTLDVLSRILNNTFYDHLPNAFHQEKSDADEYVPIRERRPSVRYNICRMVVDDSVSLLFSEGHFPEPQLLTPPTGQSEAALEEIKAQKKALIDLVKCARINEAMLEAATTGAAGSVAIHLKILRKKGGNTFRAFLQPYDTRYLTPEFDPFAPTELMRITERYKVTGADLAAKGYLIAADDLKTKFWFHRAWDDKAEIWYVPYKVEDVGKENFRLKVDNGPGRTLKHELGFVPWVWIKNLPGKLKLLGQGGTPAYSDIDGACTFEAAIETMIEMDYLLSQGGRGLKYSMDPTLLIKESPSDPDAGGGDIIKGAANALNVGAGGDAKMLEIEGRAFTVVLEFVKALREFALESIHGNRAEVSKLVSAKSGRAMEMMNQALIWLSDKLRTSYGEGALLTLIKMILVANKKYQIVLDDDEELPQIDPTKVTLKWPAWQAPTTHDMLEEAQTLNVLAIAGLMSKQTAVQHLAAKYDIEDIQAELLLIRADKEQAIADTVAEAAQVKATEVVPE